MFNDRHDRPTILCSLMLVLFVGSVSLAAPGPQAAFTTGPQGQEAGEYAYSNRLEVYISGGPGGADGLEPGDYVFQVTDPLSGVLLSMDPAACRIFTVEDGVAITLRDLVTGNLVDHVGVSDVCHVADSPEGVAGPSGLHDTNLHIDGRGIVIQLMPFAVSPNPRDVYKVWILPLENYLAQGGDLLSSPEPVTGGFAQDAGFSRPRAATTQRFKVIESDVNRAPLADAGPDQTVTPGDTVNLDGSGSTDPDGDPLSYSWTLESVPEGSAGSLVSAEYVMPQLLTDLPGTYVVSLIVNDGADDSAPDQVAITTGNSPPVANAGPDQATVMWATVTLDGSGSTDVDGDPLTYTWSVIGAPEGSEYFIFETTDVMPLFYYIQPGSYVLQLVVNDGQTDSAPDTMTVSTLNTPPVARAGLDQSAARGSTVTLNGSNSYDSDGDQLTFSWSIVTVPTGSAATLSDPTAVMPLFDLDLHGVYVAQLIVDDGEDVSNPDTVTITTINLAPTADAGSDQTVLQNDTVVLDGSGSSDPEFDPLTFSWSLLSVPAGSSATLSDPSATMPTFQADQLGDYVAQLIVNDGGFDSTPDTVMISTANVPPVAGAGPDQTLAAGTLVGLDGSGSTDADGDPLTYAWSVVSAPPSSFAVVLDPTSSQPSYLLDAVGTYVLQLIVSDGAVSSAPDTIVIESLPIQRVLLLPESDLIGLGRTVPATVRLLAAPPPGGVVVTLTADDPALVGIAPSSVTIPEGEDTARIVLDGLILGDTILRADAPDYTSGAAAVTVTDFLISIEQALVVAPGETSSLAVSLTSPAPFGGQTIFLSSADTSIATVTPSVFVPEGSQTPATNPQVTGGAIGTVEITGTAGGFAPDTAQVIVTIDIYFNPTWVSLALDTREMTLYLSAPAPAGLTLDLAIDDPGVASVPATITAVTGATTIQVPVTGVADGNTTLRVSAPGISEATGAIGVASAIFINRYGSLFVGDDLQRQVDVCLNVAAVPEGQTVVVTSTDPSLLLLLGSPTDPGSASVSLSIPGGDICGSVWLQGLAGSGEVEVTTSAPAYTDSSHTASLFPSGFVFETADFATTTLSTDVPVILGVRALDPVSLEPIWTGLDNTALRNGVDVTLNLASSDPAIGTIPGNSVTFTGGDSRLTVQFEPIGTGQTTLSVATPVGFDTPASLTAINVTVSAPPIHLGGYQRVGYQLQELQRVRLGTAPPTPVDITLTVDDPSIFLITLDPLDVGASTVVLPGVADLLERIIHLQGLAQGTAMLTVQAPGYETTTVSIEVIPSGFRFGQSVPTTISTSTLAVNWQLAIEAEVINPDIVNPFFRNRELRPGITVDVPVTSSDPAVAAVIGSPVTATGPFVPLQVEVDPLSEGVATVQIVQPPGFSTPAGSTQTEVSVSAPGISFSSSPNTGPNLRIGRDLQDLYSVSLDADPLSPVDVTISLGSATIATVTTDPTLDGSDTIVLPGMTGSETRLVGLQGRVVGTTSLTVSAPGFSTTTHTVEVTPSGFQQGGNPSLTLSTFDTNRSLTIQPVALDPTSLDWFEIQPLRPGVSAVVEVISSNPSVVGVTASPLTFSPGGIQHSTFLDPLTAGSSTVAVVPPVGFDTPARAEVAVTVTAPDVVLSLLDPVGLNLQTRFAVTLSVAPPGPVDVTVTSLSPSIAVLGVDGTVAGGSSVTFTSVAGNFVGYVWVQAIGEGSTQLVGQAAGYNDGTRSASVVPSGFVFDSTIDFTTSVTAANTTRSVRVGPLSPTTLEALDVATSQSIRGGTTATVDVSSADPGIAAAVAVPIAFTGGQSSGQFEIDPIAVGSTVLTVEPVTGFDTPAIHERELVVIVNP